MTTTLQDLKPSQIKPHKLNPRRDVGDVSELADSIREQGIVEPLIVAPNGSPDSFVLLAGHRRLAAAKSIRAKTVPCLVREDVTDPKAQIELMLVENTQRTDLSAIEEASAYQQLLEFPGYTQKRLAQATGRPIATIRARLKLAKLPKATQEQVHSGQLSLHDASVLADFAGDPVVFKQLQASAGTSNFGWAVQRVKDEQSRERAKEKSLAALAEAGVRIIDRPPYGIAYVPLGDEDVEAHRTCEGFAAYLGGYQPAPFYLCDRPDLHPDLADDADADPAQAARAELAAQLESAAVVRRAHLGGVLGSVDEDLATTVLRPIVAEKARGVPWLLEVMGLPADAKPKVMVEHIDRLDLYQLVAVLDFANADYAERDLVRGYAWKGSYTAKWRDRLATVYGYEWSAAELAAMEPDTPSGDE